MNIKRPPLKPLIWAGRIAIAFSFLMILLGLGLWTGVAGQIIDQATGENHGSSVAQGFIAMGVLGTIVGFFTIRAGTRRDII